VTSPAPIDARQQVWWHRLRRLGPWGFVLLVGGLISPLVTCLLFGGVVYAYSYPWSTFVTNGTIMYLVTAPVYVGASLWTWHHMEGRYRATLDVRCPGCGYSRRGTGGARCPECGQEVPAPPAEVISTDPSA